MNSFHFRHRRCRLWRQLTISSQRNNKLKQQQKIVNFFDNKLPIKRKKMFYLRSYAFLTVTIDANPLENRFLRFETEWNSEIWSFIGNTYSFYWYCVLLVRQLVICTETNSPEEWFRRTVFTCKHKIHAFLALIRHILIERNKKSRFKWISINK